MDLVLDIKMNKNLPWQRIGPENARAVKRAPKIDDAGHQEELDSSALQSLLGAGQGASARSSSSSSSFRTGANAAPLGGSQDETNSTGSSDS